MTAGRSEPDFAPLGPDTGPGGHAGDRVAELLDIMHVQRRLVIGVAAGVSLLGMAVATVLPDVLAPTPLVGTAVGLAACLLAVATAITADAADRYVRGPRHVLAAGGTLAAVIEGRTPGETLIAWLDRLLILGEGVRVAVAPTGIDAADGHRLADALGEALARRDRKVLVVDVSRSGMDEAGVAEASRGSVKLHEVVEMHPSLRLASVGPGRDLPGAIEGFPRISKKLPRDVDALLVATPGVRHVGVLPALTAVDRVLLLVESGRTERAELMAVLDALDVAGILADVVLANGHAARRFGPFQPRDDLYEEDPPSGDVTVLRGPSDDLGDDRLPADGPEEPTDDAPSDNETDHAATSPAFEDTPDVGPDTSLGERTERNGTEGNGAQRNGTGAEPADRVDITDRSLSDRHVSRPAAIQREDTQPIAGADPEAEAPLRLAATIDTLVHELDARDEPADAD